MMGAENMTRDDMEMIVSKEWGLPVYFSKVKTILKTYMDVDEECYSLVALWIIGTYFHKQFSSYPYLFFNAMKGSGKTRMLKIIAALSKNGKVVGSMTEAVLFRTAGNRTLCIDELESIGAKGFENVKLLLNSAYKKGLSVERMHKTKDGGQEVEEFEVYCPIAMANIWGMENVLADRCIRVVLEKSSKNEIVKLIENFDRDIEFQTTRGGLIRLTEKLQDDFIGFQKETLGEFHNSRYPIGLFDFLFDEWNIYQKNKVSSVNIVNSVNNKEKSDTTYAFDVKDTNKELFSKINDTNLSGRDLELFFPLFILADMISEETLKEIIETAKKVTKLRKEEDREENKDVRLIEFIAQSNYGGFISVSRVAEEFSKFYGEDIKYNTAHSISRALNRLKLIIEKRSTGKERQVRLNVLKAQEKLKLFKEPDLLDQFTDEEIKEVHWTRENLLELIRDQ